MNTGVVAELTVRQAVETHPIQKILTREENVDSDSEQGILRSSTSVRTWLTQQCFQRYKTLQKALSPLKS